MIKEWKRVLWLKEDEKYQNIQKTIEKVLVDQTIDQATLKNRNDHIEIITNTLMMKVIAIFKILGNYFLTIKI